MGISPVSSAIGAGVGALGQAAQAGPAVSSATGGRQTSGGDVFNFGPPANNATSGMNTSTLVLVAAGLAVVWMLKK